MAHNELRLAGAIVVSTSLSLISLITTVVDRHYLQVGTLLREYVENSIR
jgi:hypothetical protein